jgi:hypothetical protein
MLKPSENLILQLSPETIEKGYLHRLIKAKHDLNDAIESILNAEADGCLNVAGELIELSLDELELMQINALCIAAQSHQDAENERLRTNAGAGA